MRVQETIAYKQYIRSVNILYTHDKSYGNKYIRVTYRVGVNENFKKLPFNKREFLFQESPDCHFPMSTSLERFDNEDKLLRLIEFKHLYESITAYATLQLEKGLNPDTPIKVKGIDFWPLTNYAEKYLLSALEKNNKEHGNFESDVWQWERLHLLAKESGKIYASEKKDFSVKDTKLDGLFDIALQSLRYILIKYWVPIHIKGIKTIDEITIHASKLVDALKKEIETDTRKGYSFYRLILHLYEHYLPSEKEDIVNRQGKAFLKNFVVQQGDIVELVDKRIVKVESVFFGEENSIWFEYSILKNDLQSSIRTRTVSMDNAAYVLTESNFLQYPDSYIRSLPRLIKWMNKRKLKITTQPFEPDLLSNELISGE